MTSPAYADATAAVCAWINAQQYLVGRGRPLAAGAHRDPQKSPSSGAVAWVTTTSTAGDLSQGAFSYPLLTIAVYGMTDANAARGAAAVANALAALEGDAQPVGDTVLLAVDSITGPSRLPDGGEHRYLIDAVIAITPA
ncbi:hypothetical protein ACFFX1_54995 [Dactylosporangium sucinum]|uniref:Uncharacterized protein n=1 Tax=Dactylosporangium sucinum TaxID=1424081 RepID=A0A917U3Q6_9ACTN|nr:hypothetical protein [Dactylosporangium sucinum]GGM53261.1 hypothetical protein GCM10007977_063610 [Dactylosporangium sucinum]